MIFPEPSIGSTMTAARSEAFGARTARVPGMSLRGTKRTVLATEEGIPATRAASGEDEVGETEA